MQFFVLIKMLGKRRKYYLQCINLQCQNAKTFKTFRKFVPSLYLMLCYLMYANLIYAVSQNLYAIIIGKSQTDFKLRIIQAL